MNRRTIAAILVAALTALGVVSSTASADTPTPPPTLSGEELFGTPPINLTGNCNISGTSTLSFSVSGVATGPYPGTFTEVGTATVGPQTVDLSGGNALGTLLTFDAVFTIHSSVGDVTGTKTLTVIDPAGSVGTCATLNDAEIRFLVARSVRYQAEISTAGGEFADRGLVPLVTVQRDRFVSSDLVFFQDFYENFLSDLTATEPLTSAGQATGGGRIPGDINFGFTAKSDNNGFKGNCTVIDRSSGTMVKCLDATSYFQAGTHATFGGNATINGSPTTYRIKVDDNGEPGAGLDTFTITTTSGYSATGVLTDGNIQVHP
jgi:hypothetical protein